MSLKNIIISFTILLFFTSSCKTQSSIVHNDTTVNSRSLSISEIKYIYHEAIRRLFFEQDIFSVVLRLNDFYDQREINGTLINCGMTDFEFMVLDEIDNKSIEKYFNKNNIIIKNKISSLEYLKSMEFYFQPKIYFANLNDSKVSLKSPKMGYFTFSDIYSVNNNTYYMEATLVNRLTCEDIKEIYSAWNYTFEIERCKSGFLRFKRIIVGDGEALTTHYGVISTIKTLTDTPACE